MHAVRVGLGSASSRRCGSTTVLIAITIGAAGLREFRRERNRDLGHPPRAQRLPLGGAAVSAIVVAGLAAVLVGAELCRASGSPCPEGLARRLQVAAAPLLLCRHRRGPAAARAMRTPTMPRSAIPIRLALAAAVAAAAATAAGCGGNSAAGSSAATLAPRAVAATAAACRSGAATRVPLRHVVSTSWRPGLRDVIGSPAAPYLTRLAASCGLATRFAAEAHPSLPDYIAMTSGSTQGIRTTPTPLGTPARPSLFSARPALARPRRVDAAPVPISPIPAGTPFFTTRPRPYTGVGRARHAGPPSGAHARVHGAVHLRHAELSATTCTRVPSRTATVPCSPAAAAVDAHAGYRTGSMVVFINRTRTTARQPASRPSSSRGHVFRHALGDLLRPLFSMLRTTEEILGLPTLGAAARAASMRAASNSVSGVTRRSPSERSSPRPHSPWSPPITAALPASRHSRDLRFRRALGLRRRERHGP